MGISRREFLQGAALAGISMALPFKFGAKRAYPFAQTTPMRKFVTTLPGVGPAGVNNYSQYLPLATKTTQSFGGVATDFYSLAVGEFSQQVHPDLPGQTNFWGYHDVATNDQKYLAGVIVAKRGTPVVLQVANQLPNRQLIPIDLTLMAGPPMTPGGMPITVGDLALNRHTTHLHGGFVPWISDGTPFQWFDPSGGKGESFNTVPGIAAPLGTGTYYYPMDQSARLLWYHDHAVGITRTNAYSGIASALILTDDFEAYLIRQGLVPDLVGIPLVIQDKCFVPADVAAQDPSWDTATWGGPGSLWYPHDYEAPFTGPGVANPKGRWDWGATLHQLPTDPPNAANTMPLPAVSAVPEFFADTALINGAPYPLLNVSADTIRFRLLNASQARFWHLSLYEEGATAGEADPAKPGPVMYQIATEGGFLPGVVALPNIPIPLDLAADPSGNTAVPSGPFNLLLAPAERADLLIDFTGKAGKSYILYNDAPAPFPMGDPRNDYYTGDPDFTNDLNNAYGLSGGAPSTASGQGPNTRTIMKITVGASATGFTLTTTKLNALNQALKKNFTGGNPVAPQQPALLYKGADNATPGALPYTGPVHRQLTLNEDFDEYGRLIQREGTFAAQPVNNQGLATWGMDYLATATETPTAGATEVWEIYNLTGDVHPIHFHLVNVQVIQRQAFTGDPGIGITLTPNTVRGPDANEVGWKETVRMSPGEVTTVIAKFDLPKVPFPVFPSVSADRGISGNEYVWHCHILEHEEHDMMRPLVVSGNLPLAVVPATRKVPNSDSVTFTIVNGQLPYSVSTPDPRFPPSPTVVNANGGTFSVNAGAAVLARTTTFSYVITDGAGKKVTAMLTITK